MEVIMHKMPNGLLLPATMIQFQFANQMSHQEINGGATDVLHKGATPQRAADAMVPRWWLVDPEDPFPSAAADGRAGCAWAEAHVQVLSACTAIYVRLTKIEIAIEALVSWASDEMLAVQAVEDSAARSNNVATMEVIKHCRCVPSDAAHESLSPHDG